MITLLARAVGGHALVLGAIAALGLALGWLAVQQRAAYTAGANAVEARQLADVARRNADAARLARDVEQRTHGAVQAVREQYETARAALREKDREVQALKRAQATTGDETAAGTCLPDSEIYWPSVPSRSL